jgi:DNA-binding CsgD family transcriptional regulator
MANQRDQAGSVTRNGVTLTKREMDVLRETANGRTTNQIASRLQVPPARVKQIRSQIKLNFGLGVGAGPEEMVAHARTLGFIK